MARSTLELLLESIKARDEEPSDQPPVLPQRPLSIGRLPAAALRVKKMAAAAGAIASSVHHYGNGEKMLVQTCGPMDPTVNRKEISLQASEPTAPQNHRENGVSVASSVKAITMMEEDLPVEHQVMAEFEDTARTAASLNTPEFHLEFNRDETPQKRMRVDPISGLKKGSNIWYIDKNTNKWTIGTVESHKNMESMIRSSINNQIISIPHAGMLPANPKVLDDVDDLIQLGFVNEPSVLHNLQVRYTMNNVYTKVGSILIALNPFEEAQTKTSIDVCAFAANVMRALERDRVNQSIILSGESDAGKTELSKLLIQCFNNGQDENGFLFSVLQANRILESLGSAKIQNNPNASFLGKLVNLYMNDLGRVSMVQFHTVLFDESRVVHRVDDEQSYHIFYQLCEGAGQALRDHLKIRSVEDFEYLKGSKLSGKAGSDYCVEFKLLISAFRCLGFDERDQEFVFSILAAILWIGNIPSRCLTTKDGEVLLEKCEEIENVVGLLKCSREALLKALSPNRQKETDFGATNQQDFTEISARDMLAESLYTFLFEWIVSCINKFLMRRLTDMHKCIIILDMPGFGSSENSRLKQPLLCYSYKQLQGFINHSFFQQEDDRSTPLSEDKNRSASGCLQLMERKFDASLHPQKKSGQLFDASNTNGEIIQNGLYFKEILEFLSLCMPHTIEPLDQRKNAGSGNAFLPYFISTSHSAACWEQFSCIMRNVERTAPHLALCIRPNKSQCAKAFDEDLVLNQLRVSRLLDLLSMAKSGFRIHVSQDDFADRFGILLSNCPSKEVNMLEICIEVLRKFSASPHMYQVGLNRLSFRLGEIEKLENARERFLQGVLCIQKCYRGYKVRCQMHQRRNALIFLQSSVRGWLARREFKHILKLGAENRDSIDDLTDASMKPERDHQEIERKKEDSSAHEVDPYEGQWKERALAAEEILAQKESENTLLQQKLNESDERVLEYEAKMRSMEEKLKSLDATLTSGKDDAVPGESQIQTSIKDTETVHVGQETAALTQREKSVKGKAPVTRPNPRLSQGNPVKSSELADPSSRSVLDHLTKEFEHRTQIFNDDADFLVEVKSGQTEANFKPEEELRKLKQRFDVWKKDFNVRLQETKGILKKLGKSEATDKSNKSKSSDKSKKTWWGKKVN